MNRVSGGIGYCSKHEQECLLVMIVRSRDRCRGDAIGAENGDEKDAGDKKDADDGNKRR